MRHHFRVWDTIADTDGFIAIQQRTIVGWDGAEWTPATSEELQAMRAGFDKETGDLVFDGKRYSMVELLALSKETGKPIDLYWPGE